MSLFGSKIAAADAQVVTLLAMLATVGYKPASAAEATSEGFAAALASHVKTASDAAVATALATPSAELVAFRDGLKTAGVAITFGAEQPTAAAVTQAVEAAVRAAGTKEAAHQVANSGHETPLAIAKSAASVNAQDEAPTDAADFMAKLNAFTDAGKRQAYFRAHKAKFIK